MSDLTGDLAAWFSLYFLLLLSTQALQGRPIYILEQIQHRVVKELHAFSEKWDRRPLQAKLEAIMGDLGASN